MRFDEIPLLLPNAERSNTRDRAQRETDGDDLDAGKGSAKSLFGQRHGGTKLSVAGAGTLWAEQQSAPTT